ncbi:MAG TPA: M36 family metallopeptidase [Anaerolineae bacterium]|nr:M36 family metallopeptidase [Anaerolineae bacterium]
MPSSKASQTKAPPQSNTPSLHTQTSQFLTPPSNLAPLDIVNNYLQTHKSDFGLTAADLASATVTDQYTSRGITHIYMFQTLNGYPVHNAMIGAHLMADGRIIRITNDFVPDAANKANTDLAQISVDTAITAARQDVKSTSATVGTTRQLYQVVDGTPHLAWEVELRDKDDQNIWLIRVDAVSGKVLDKHNQVIHEDFKAQFANSEQWRSANNYQLPASTQRAYTPSLISSSPSLAPNEYTVYAWPVEDPGHASPAPPADARTIETDPATAPSPFGWHDTDGVTGNEFTVTRGNNVNAYEDGNNPGFQPDCGATINCNFPIDLTVHPDNYEAAAITNLFYWNNIIHDVWYLYGFDEASGNFQENNYGNGGAGGDSVNAEAQDGSGTCNANMSTPADGGNPRMQMYICDNNGDGIPSDGDLDNGVIAHEYWHGISIRLTGGPSNSGCLSSLSYREQGGEGWSDYGGLSMTIEAGDTSLDARGIGTYLFEQGPNGPGIRPQPYSTDFAINNSTYDTLKTGVSVPHGVGWVWASMLWEMQWNLVDKGVTQNGLDLDIYNGTGGNNLAMSLVIEGLKQQNCGPSFIDARDGILAADLALYSGENQCVIWEAFARRGLGFSADDGGSAASETDGTEAFDLPPACSFVSATPPAQDVCVGSNVTYDLSIGTGYTNPPVTLSAANEPAGATVTFGTNPVNGPYPATTTMSIGNITAPNVGPHTITITGADTGTINESTTVDLTVYPNTVGTPNLTTPADTATNESILPDFSWSAVSGASSYYLEVATDMAFSNIVYTATTSTNSHTTTSFLAGSTTHYWRVTASNLCTTGTPSSVFSFTTADITCQTFSSTGPVSIPDNSSTTSTISTGLSGINTVEDVNVTLVGTHTYIGDLDFILDSPGSASSITIADLGSCGSADNFDFTVDDSAATSFPCPPTDGGTYLPSNPLNGFNGDNATGDWTLTIVDNAGLDTGTVSSWSIDICYQPVNDFDVSATPTTVDICQPNDATFNIDVLALGDYTDPVTLSVAGEPAGTSTAFSPNPVNPAPGSSTLTIGNTTAATPGTYPLTITGVGSSGTHTDTVNLNLFAGAPTNPTLTSPADNALDVPSSPTLTWSPVADASSYFLEVATDASFTTIVYTATTAATSETVSLSSATTYYWRVTASNGCGAGATSAIFSFTTADLTCQTFYTTDVPQTIPTTVSSITANIDTGLTGNNSVIDVNVILVGTHTWVGDLDFVVESPGAASTVTVADLTATCGNQDNFDFILDDEATGNFPCPPTGGGSYLPSNPLSTFDGDNATGIWTLTVNDNVGADGGQLTEWGLEICYGDVPTIDVNPTTINHSQPANTSSDHTITISNVGTGNLSWTIQEEPGAFTNDLMSIFTAPTLGTSAPTLDAPAPTLDPAGLTYLTNATNAAISLSPATGAANFVRFPTPQTFATEANASATTQADAFLTQHGAIFGITSPATELTTPTISRDQYGFTHLEYQQQYQGVPVFGGTMRAHANADGALTTVNGVFIPNIDVNSKANLTADEATILALSAVMAQPYSSEHEEGHAKPEFALTDLEAEPAQLYIYRTNLLQQIAGHNHLVYEVEVRYANTLREFIYIDAHNGKVVDRFSAIHDAMFRRLFEGNTSTQVWQEGDAFPGSLNADQQNIVVASEDSYNFFANAFGRDSYDDAGAELQSVNNDPTISCPNANWNGNTTNYCNGVTADDVVAHEWGHAYTEYTNGLIYAWQTGALNESYSDIWGETVDLLNGYGNDTGDTNPRTSCNNAELRWQMGEDATAFGGAIRDMWDPTCDGDPGKVTDTEYWCSTGDAGGVHINSGIPNRAYSLMVDGGTFNGQTITALGLTKSAHIHWRAQSVYETNTSDFPVHADALEAACTDLIGIDLQGLSTNGPAGPSGEIITTADCQEVAEVILAVEFRTEPSCGFAPMFDPNAPALCSAGTAASNILFEDFETGLGSWTVSQAPSNPATWDARDWTITSSLPDARPGNGVYGPDPVVGDCQTDLDNGIIRLDSPAVNIPAAANTPIRMAFDHYASMEQDWDGGNLKISINGGAFTLVPNSAFTFNGYPGTLNTAGAGNDNPLAGQAAFTGANGGSVAGSWGQSQLDLSSLGVNPGDSVQLRWELGTDGCNGWDGWYVDDVQIYSCVQLCTAPADVSWLSLSTLSGTTAEASSTPITATLDSTGLAAGNYSANVCINSNDANSPLYAVPISMTVTGCSAPTPPSNIDIYFAGANDVMLSWADTGDDNYEVWWSDTPYFMPGDAGSNQNMVNGPFSATVTWAHSSVMSNGTNYFYVVTNSCGLVSSSAVEREGKFDFNLTPGQ